MKCKYYEFDCIRHQKPDCIPCMLGMIVDELSEIKQKMGER